MIIEWGKPLLVNAKFSPSIYDPTQNPIEQGNISSSNGQNTTSNAAFRLRTNGYIPVIAGMQYRLDTNLDRVFCYYYNDDQSYTSGSTSGWVDVPNTVTVPSGKAYVRIILAMTRSIEITPSDVDYLTIQPAQNSMIYMS